MEKNVHDIRIAQSQKLKKLSKKNLYKNDEKT